MNRKNSLLLKIGLIFSICFVAFSGNARSFTFQGKEVLEDQPEGNLQYFDVDYEYCFQFNGAGSTIYTNSSNFILPLIFGDDGKVYTRNLTDEGGNIWIEGIVEGDDLIFFADCEIEFIPRRFILLDMDPYTYMSLGRCDFDEKKIGGDETLEKLVFSKTVDGGYRMNMPQATGIRCGNFSMAYLKYNYTLRPSGFQPVAPPKGYKEEDYQIEFIPFAQTFAPGLFDDTQLDAALRLKVVRTDNEFYVKGLNFLTGTSDLWLKGKIEGNKVVFPHGAFMGVGETGKPTYANVVEFENQYWSGGGHGHAATVVSALGQDLVFDYEPESGNLSNPSACWDINTEADASWVEDLSYEDLYLTRIKECDFYNKPRLKKIPENHQYQPLPPEVVPVKSFYKHELRVSYLDAQGYMMDPFKMYIKKFNPEDSIPVSMKILNVNNWEEEYSDMDPYGFYYLIFSDNVVDGTNIGNNQRVSDSSWDVTAYSYELVYMDGEECFSSKTAGTATHPLLPLEDNSPYFDLTGRRINPENLSPGIYIHNGRKIILP